MIGGLASLTETPGCSCKLDQETVGKIASLFGTLGQPRMANADSDIWNREDAAVVSIGGGRVVVATVDFMTPLVDDAFEWGQATACHALSDVYAMGAIPSFALNILAWPDELLEDPRLQRLIAGGAECMNAAGVSVLGGHAIRDRVPKFGFCVIGFGERDKLLLKGAARQGDKLVLTKPLGTGLATSALRDGHEFELDPSKIYGFLRSLNDKASAIAIDHKLLCGTDVTGFGLIGHLAELLQLSGVSGQISYSKIPILPGVAKLAKIGYSPSLAWRNLDQCRSRVRFADGIDEHEKLVLADPQTSGGLILSVTPDKVSSLLHALRASGSIYASEIGEITPLRPDGFNLMVEG